MIILKPRFSSIFSIPFAALPENRDCNCVSKVAAGFPANSSLPSLSRNCVMAGVALNAWVGDPAMRLS